MLSFLTFTSFNTTVVDDKIGEVVLNIQGEGWHKVELLNPEQFDTLHLHIKVDCDSPSRLYKRVSYDIAR